MTATIASFDVRAMRLRRPRFGPWHVSECSIVGEHSELDQTVVTLSIDGIEWSGFVTLARAFSGSTAIRMVGGSGGLMTELPAQHYLGPNPEIVIRAIISSAGETLDDSSAIPNVDLSHWLRAGGKASHCLTAICDKAGLVWRVLPNGNIWVGSESWDTVSPDAEWIDEDWSDGVVILGSDDFANLADVAPGRTLEGHKLEQVEHVVADSRLRTIAAISSPESAASEFLVSIRREMDPLKSYPCQVVRQNSDGTLQLKPEDPRVSGNGLDGIQIRHGLPGFEVKVTAGARVRLHFDNGDKSQPYAATWDSDTDSVTTVEYKPGGASSPACKTGDTVSIQLPANLPVTGTVDGAAFVGMITVTSELTGVIDGPGNAKLLI